MHMRKIAKAICAALSLMLIVNLAGFEVTAAGVDDQAAADQTGGAGNGTEGDSGNKEPATDPADKTDNGEDNQISGGGDGASSDGTSPDGTGTGENGSNDDSTGENNGSTPENPENPAEPGQAGQDTPEPDQVEPQVIEGLTAKAAAGSKDELEISWTVRPEVTYTLKVTDEEGKEIFNRSGLISGKEKVKVTAGKRYDVTVADNAGENPNSMTIPAVLLLSPAVKATLDGKSAKLAWSAVAGADSYEVAYNGKTEKVAGTTYTLDKAEGVDKVEVTAVCALKDTQSKEYLYKSVPGKAQIVQVEKPEKVTDLTGIDGDRKSTRLNSSH